MQFIASADEMRRFDRQAIRSLGIPGVILMENAGRSFVDALDRMIGQGGKWADDSLQQLSVRIVCGRGNNGGDGFVIARYLAGRGCDVHLFLLGKRSAVSGEARVHLGAARKVASLPGVRLAFHEVSGVKELMAGGKADVTVDAILGTGFTGEVRGLYAEAIAWINRQKSFVVAADMPSGVDATTGCAGKFAVHAHATIAMGLAKIGHCVGAGVDLSGEVVIADIGIPPGVFRPGKNSSFRVSPSDVEPFLPHRARTANKYSAGKVLVIGGSRRYIGAPLMTARAALRSGAGAVVLAVPRSIREMLARRGEELLFDPQEETADGSLSLSALPALLRRVEWADAVAIGPGLSRAPETLEMVRRVVARSRCPLVIDADALSALQGLPGITRKRKFPTILTPHAGEFAALTGGVVTDVETRRVELCRRAARLWGCTMVLKGAPTVTSSPDGLSFINASGNPGLATIGSGDVLTGMIAGLCARGVKTPAAAFAGVSLHGLAGDVASDRRGQQSVTAPDIIDCIGDAFKQAGV